MYAVYTAYMPYTSQESKRTYVTAIDAKTKRRAKCITVYGLTPRDVIRLIRDAINQLRKAG